HRVYTGKVVEQTDPRGRAHYWIGGGEPEWGELAGTDMGAIHAGDVSVTPLHLDLTNHRALDQLADLASSLNAQYRPAARTRARGLLEQLSCVNVWVRVGSGTLGWPDEAPFDRILVTAGGPGVPPPLFQQLAESGRMVLPIGDAENQRLTVVEKAGGEMRMREAGECKFVKLVGKYAWEA